jgi:hypothetical protein
MKRFTVAIAIAAVLAFAGTAAAALVPGVFDPGNTGCPTATYSNGVLHLAKNCATSTNAAAGADITGLEGQAFTGASFTLASASQCQGGSPRFDVVTTDGLFFFGCNNVTPTINGDGSATYTFMPADAFNTSGVQSGITGTIQSADILIDVQGTADITNIVVNGVTQVPLVGPPTSKDQCKDGGWKSFNNPTFKNQGQCVSFVASHGEKQHNQGD